jgi:tRNA dimethylallyltransferase
MSVLRDLNSQSRRTGISFAKNDNLSARFARAKAKRKKKSYAKSKNYRDMNIQAKPKIIAIVGPTASGKTALGISLAKKYHGEIVSADSRQIYRGMDIGTAKSPLSEQENIPHYLLDIKNPDEDYTVADYKHDAVAAIENILKKKKLPIMVGGTGLYIDAVLDNLDIPEIKADPELRAKIERDIAENGLAAIFKKLVDRDPEAAYLVDPKNPRRVVRALEVAILTGEPFTAQRKKNEPIFAALKIGVNPLPEILRQRIDLRVDLMIQDGLVSEVETLVKKYGAARAAFDAIGYREIIGYLNGKMSLEQASDIMKHNTWHYAKRQMTWFRKDKKIRWVTEPKETETLVEDFLKPGFRPSPE